MVRSAPPRRHHGRPPKLAAAVAAVVVAGVAAAAVAMAAPALALWRTAWRRPAARPPPALRGLRRVGGPCGPELANFGLPRRRASALLWLWPAAPIAPAAAPAEQDHRQAAADVVDEFLSALTVFAVTDESGAPLLTEELGRTDSRGAADDRVGRFYFDEADAKGELKRAGALMARPLEVRRLSLADVYLPLVVGGSAAQLGGRFRLVPDAREVANALRLLSVDSLGPPGVVPLFLCTLLEVQRRSGEARVPVFVHEADLRESLQRAQLPEGESNEVIVTTLDKLIADLAKPGSAASQILPVSDIRDIGLGNWM